MPKQYVYDESPKSDEGREVGDPGDNRESEPKELR